MDGRTAQESKEKQPTKNTRPLTKKTARPDQDRPSHKIEMTDKPSDGQTNRQIVR